MKKILYTISCAVLFTATTFILVANAATAGIPVSVPTASTSNYVLLSNSEGRYEPTFMSFIGAGSSTLASSGVVLGDSSFTAYAGHRCVCSYLITPFDTLVGTTLTNKAVAGNTINQQKTAWSADANRGTYDWILVFVGANDLSPAEAASTSLARYQSLIDTINADKKSTAIVLVATMGPIRQVGWAQFGTTTGDIAYQKWLDMNDAIMGNGANKITGVSYRISKHTEALDDGNGNLAEVFQGPDRIHATDEAQKIIASVFRETLQRAGFLNGVAPALTDNVFTGTSTGPRANPPTVFQTFSKGGAFSLGGSSTPALPAILSVQASTSYPSTYDLLIVGTTSQRTALKVDYIGNTGLGSSTPAGRLGVVGNIYNEGNLYVAGNSTTSTIVATGTLTVNLNTSIGTTGSTRRLNVAANASGVGVAVITNSNTAGFSMLDFADSGATTQAGCGYGNSSAAVLAVNAFCYTNSKDFSLSTNNGTSKNFMIQASTRNIFMGTTTASSSVIINGSATTNQCYLSDSSGTITWDWSQCNDAEVNLTGTGRTLTFTNARAGQHASILLFQGGGGSKTITTYPAAVRFSGGSSPTLTTTAGYSDLLTFIAASSTAYIVGGSVPNMAN